MSTPKRRTLAERNRDAINGTTEQAQSGTDAAARPSVASVASGTGRVSAWMPLGLYEAMKSAFLADWETLHQHNAYGEWVADALHRHAQRTPQERAGLVYPTYDGRNDGRNDTRRFVVDAATEAAIRQAIITDQRAGRPTTISTWCVEALTAAVDEARERNNGQLPVWNGRLPQRLL